MVGVFLGRPQNCQAGMVVMRAARDTLLALGSRADALCSVVVTKDDDACIRMKATWQDNRFTLTLTGNTGYVFIQGPSASLLAFGSYVADELGGVLHVAKDVGVDPHNPGAHTGDDQSVEHETTSQSQQPQQQQQQTGAQPEGATSSGTSASDGASGGPVLSGQGNVMVNVSFHDNTTDLSAQVEGLAEILRSALNICPRRGSAQRDADA